MDANSQLNRWKWLCYLQSLFALETFIAPVLVLFYTQYAGFSFAQYAILMSYIFILSWAFQLPTGAIADKYGKKKALIGGNLIYILAMVAMVVFEDRIPTIVTAALFSMGGALSTGAFQAMMFSAFASAGMEREFNAVTARGNSLALLGGAVGAALGSILAGVLLALPMIVDIVVLSATTIVLGLAITSTPDEQRSQPASLNSIAIDAISAAHNSSTLLGSILVSAVAFAGVRTDFSLYQPLRMLDGPAVLILIALAFMCAAGLVAGLPTTIGVICAIACQQLVRAVYPSLSAYVINMNIATDSHSRTTILSLAALLRPMLAALFSYAMAIMSGRISDAALFGAVNFVSSIAILTFGLWSVYAMQSKKPAKASIGR